MFTMFSNYHVWEKFTEIITQNFSISIDVGSAFVTEELGHYLRLDIRIHLHDTIVVYDCRLRLSFTIVVYDCSFWCIRSTR